MRTPVSDTEPRGRAGDGQGVVIRLSPEARKYLGAERDENRPTGAEVKAGEGEQGGQGAIADKGATPEESGAGRPRELTPQDQDTVRKLQARDAEVRAHEAAHMAAAGGHGSGASYDYQMGPDGRRYAVGGEVQVTVPSGGSPEEMLRNAQTMRAAALAPADPSSQDLAVAAQAAQMEVQAHRQKDAERTQEQTQTQTQADVQAAHHDKGNAEKHDKATKDASANPPETDPLKVFSALKSERMAVQGGNFGHPHTPGACGFCSGAAARYA
ncbi:MAG TPA: putative metalloprotease CJM1_0395 family protein [Polyangia bacterium]|nr:putative metalloprotease CJM1_0395 family protein [Polyangia bacterium]